MPDLGTLYMCLGCKKWFTLRLALMDKPWPSAPKIENMLI